MSMYTAKNSGKYISRKGTIPDILSIFRPFLNYIRSNFFSIYENVLPENRKYRNLKSFRAIGERKIFCINLINLL